MTSKGTLEGERKKQTEGCIFLGVGYFVLKCHSLLPTHGDGTLHSRQPYK